MTTKMDVSRQSLKRIAHNLSDIKKELHDTTLVAVTKYSPVEDVMTAYQFGHYDFGENKVQDLKEKAQKLDAQKMDLVRWHMIGHLQTNKVRELYKIPHLYAIHSVDSLHLLKEMIKRERELIVPEVKIFLQVNTSHEEEKSGFETMAELNEAISFLREQSLQKIKLYGLMTMGTIRTNDFEQEAIRCFHELRNIARQLEASHQLGYQLKLSMGMSRDYTLALAEGSDFVRIGSAIFK